LRAAITLAAVGEKARPAIEQIKKAARDKNKGDYPLFTRWALEHALKKLEE
jgi:hypothetical protein